jgi:hypothetical protein
VSKRYPEQLNAVRQRKELVMRCGFCARHIHIIEDYIYHEGLTFHPQRAAEDDVHCSPRVRSFDEETALVPVLAPVAKGRKMRTAPVNGPA